MSCTTESGTSFDAAVTWSWVGQVRTAEISSAARETPEAYDVRC
jgi:hypothetical protein